MPLINEQTHPFPDWCELRSFTIMRLAPGESSIVTPSEPKSIVIVGRGQITVDRETHADGAVLHLANAPITITAGDEGATAILMNGHWGEDCGGLGIFGAREVDSPTDNGDPVDYPKATAFDAHYHDCDEYWIVFEGKGTAVSEGIAYDVGPGDCVATGMGHHHDLPRVDEPIRAVFFETTLQGGKRRGHLWNHTHGQANPQPERV